MTLYRPVPQRAYTHDANSRLKIPVSERLIDSLKVQVMYAATQEQAREAVEMLAAFGYRAKPALSDLMRECDDEKVRQYCREALHRLGWISE